MIHDSELVGIIEAAAKAAGALALFGAKGILNKMRLIWQSIWRGQDAYERAKSLVDPNDWRNVARSTEGIALIPLATQNGQRNGTREHILAVQQAGHPLTVELEALATRVLLDDGNVAIGVEYLKGRSLYRADPRAARRWRRRRAGGRKARRVRAARGDPGRGLVQHAPAPDAVGHRPHRRAATARHPAARAAARRGTEPAGSLRGRGDQRPQERLSDPGRRHVRPGQGRQAARRVEGVEARALHQQRRDPGHRHALEAGAKGARPVRLRIARLLQGLLPRLQQGVLHRRAAQDRGGRKGRAPGRDQEVPLHLGDPEGAHQQHRRLRARCAAPIRATRPRSTSSTSTRATTPPRRISTRWSRA